MKYPDDMDKEVIALCDAINAFHGLETISSCCGHGEREFAIYFKAASIPDLVPLLDVAQPCHCCNPVGAAGWRVEARWNIASDVTFALYGPAGAYEDANKMAAYILAGKKKEKEEKEPA